MCPGNFVPAAVWLLKNIFRIIVTILQHNAWPGGDNFTPDGSFTRISKRSQTYFLTKPPDDFCLFAWTKVLMRALGLSALKRWGGRVGGLKS